MLQLISGRVLAQSSVLPVEYVPWQDFDTGLFFVALYVGGEWVGLHAREGSGDVLYFLHERHAKRFCSLRNGEEQARVKGVRRCLYGD